MIRRGDRISAVLGRDESLLEVFVSLSPAFERLRNRGMRKVMSRLVTVEQAAGMAGIDPDLLVSRLNERIAGRGNEGGVGASTVTTGTSEEVVMKGADAGPDGTPAAFPPVLERIPPSLRVEVDVRDDLRAGNEPFARIMAARRTLPEGGALAVRAIFDPVPLRAVMARGGLTHHTERLGEEDWRVWFYPGEAGDGGTSGEPAKENSPADGPSTAPAALDPAGAGLPPGMDPETEVIVLDVRGLEPPEPMMRTLAALETLPVDGTLVQLNVRVPQFLLPVLEERGFSHEIREQEPGLVRLFIRHRRADRTGGLQENDR